MIRALRLFGNGLGNSVYDKEHVKAAQAEQNKPKQSAPPAQQPASMPSPYGAAPQMPQQTQIQAFQPQPQQQQIQTPMQYNLTGNLQTGGYQGNVQQPNFPNGQANYTPYR